MSAYSAASKAVYAIFRDTAPLVEGLSIDEAFLDVRGLERICGTPSEIAQGLRVRVREEVGLPIAVGIEATLAAMLGGASGRHLYAPAHNRDPRPVRTRPRRRSIGAQRALGGQRALGARSPPPADVAAALLGLVERDARLLRAAERVCRTVVPRLRFADCSRTTRSSTMATPTAATAAILAVANELLGGVGGLIGERGLTLIGIAVRWADADRDRGDQPGR